MNRKIAALLAALLLITLAGCKKEEAPLPTPAPPVVTEPEQPETPEQPEKPEAEPKESAAVTEALTEGSAEEVVGYRISMPAVALPNGEAAQRINDYYESMAGKMRDLAWGELYEQALGTHAVLGIGTNYEVAYNQDGVLSFFRYTNIWDEETTESQLIYASETFNLENGGLLTLDDLFTIPESEYTPKLVELFIAQSLVNEAVSAEEGAHPEWMREIFRTTFDKTHFVIREEGLQIYYQAEELGWDKPHEHVIAWSELEDILKKP